MINDKDDFKIDSFADDDSDFENFFDEVEKATNIPEAKPIVKGKGIRHPKKQTPKKNKRTICDFEPDMDALLMTAQSSMVIEGMDCYNAKKFSADTLLIYIEALKGIDFYVKILERNPNNYRKLKTLIDSDNDCQRVEKIAFDFYKKEHGEIPESDKEKEEAFSAFKKIFKKAANKASISKSIKIIRKYYLLSGGLDLEKIQKSIKDVNIETKRDINNFHQHLKLALNMLKKGDSEITKGLKGKDLNIYITKASELLGYYYELQKNTKVSDYYYRIHNIYKKYFIIKD